MKSMFKNNNNWYVYLLSVVEWTLLMISMQKSISVVTTRSNPPAPAPPAMTDTVLCKIQTNWVRLGLAALEVSNH